MGQLVWKMISLTPFLDRQSGIPVYVQLYRYVKQEIASGRLKEGDRLPSVREMASYLAISKNTVSVAYQQLISEGYAESRSRSGLYVLYSAEPSTAPIPDRLSRNRSRQAHSGDSLVPYNFVSGGIDTRSFPVSAWRRCLVTALHSTVKNSLGYGNALGDDELREELAAYLFQSRGIDCSPDQICITAGSQHSLGLLCRFLAISGRAVAMENPGWRGARAVFVDHNCTIDEIPLDSGGIRIAPLTESSAKLVYVTPSHQFPMGMVMGVQRRNELLEWAEKRNGYIVEDDYDSEFRYSGDPIPAMKAIDRQDRVIYMGTLSKVFLPSVRLSYLVVPRALTGSFQVKLAQYNQSVSPLIQHALQLFMKEGHFEKHVRKMRRVYQKKYAVLIESIRNNLGDSATVVGRNAGLHIVLKLTGGDGAEFQEKAVRAGVRVEPVTVHCSPETRQMYENCFIIGFGELNAEEIEAGIRRLGK
ncbi:MULTISPECIES: PLP-dependent aminotransferase family protein [unclassified Cohnella]|uniref:MocR-like pyridoxine biosynthesis transcription factor PdxR n=1 Tax=unclassified Cohnella TaxID=2636738 RepID=UPI001E31CB24|nr:MULTISPECIES: PLP-dependent aminotransferase family protein [unclassified Cohnella]